MRSRSTSAAVFFAGLGIALCAVAVAAIRAGVLSPKVGLMVLFSGVLAAVVAVPVAVIAVLRDPTSGGRRAAWAALAIAAVTLIGPAVTIAGARGTARIHDITTDTVDPPRFEQLARLRPRDANPLEYTREKAEAQRAGYPDLKPLVISASPPAAFERALSVARDLGWEIVATDRPEWRIEASHSTFWMGFTDDIVVRIRPVSDGSRVDVRSVSRVGVGDAGKNAARIRAFLDGMRLE
jgi:uncharacterized protein (DUF1499 family)